MKPDTMDCGAFLISVRAAQRLTEDVSHRGTLPDFFIQDALCRSRLLPDAYGYALSLHFFARQLRPGRVHPSRVSRDWLLEEL